MSLFQIIAVLFALFMLYLVRIHGKTKVIGGWEMLLWSIMWVCFAIAALFPEMLLGVVDTIRFGRVFDLLTVLGLMILSTVVFITYFNQKTTNKKLEKIVRKEALSKFGNSK